MKVHGGQSMTGSVKRVLVCDPRTASWAEAGSGWRSLGYFREPDAGRAEAQHARLVEALESTGAEVHFLPRDPRLTLDSVYAHDASFPTDHGMILMHMGKPARRGEPSCHEALYRSLGVAILGRIEPPGQTEAGDMIWLDETTLLIGEGYRTNADGIEQVRRFLQPFGVTVVGAPLPYGPGPDACLHLMSLISVLDVQAALVDLPWLAVGTVRLLEERGFELIHIETSERDSLACNVLALGNRKLLAIEENRKTNARLKEAGFEVLTFPGSEVCANGSGGPTCLTRPFLRG
jgi:N-dimethylarginine dimethylaminohydrolase